VLTPLRAGRRVDPFSKKDWYEVKAPSMFSSRNVGKTLVTRTQGTKVAPRYGLLARCADTLVAASRLFQPAILFAWSTRGNLTRSWVLQIASDGLKGRVFDVSLADLQKVRSRSERQKAPRRLQITQVAERSATREL
jgi:ribosomal protein S3AE